MISKRRILGIAIVVAVVILPTGVVPNDAFCKKGDETGRGKEPVVSLVDLLCGGERYKGQRVRVAGYFYCTFEECALYLSQDDGRYLISANGIWIEFDNNHRDRHEWEKASGHFVRCEGVWLPEKRGHLGMWAGTLADVERIHILSQRSRVVDLRECLD